MKDSTYIGIYLGFCNVVESCQRYGLAGLEKGLRTWEQQAPVKEPVKKLELSELIKITDLASTVIVRRLDLKINANNIFKLAGHARNKGYCLRKKVDSQAFNILRARGIVSRHVCEFQHRNKAVSRIRTTSIGAATLELATNFGRAGTGSRAQSCRTPGSGQMAARVHNLAA